MTNDISKAMRALLDRALGSDDVEVAKAAAHRPWVRRGVSCAMARLGIVSNDDTSVITAAVWGLAFEAGALDAMRFARIVLSDPAIKGRQIEALKLLEEGLPHAGIIAKLRATAPDSAASQPDECKIVAFPSREGRA